MMRLINVHVYNKKDKFLYSMEGLETIRDKIVKSGSTVFFSKKWGMTVVAEPYTKTVKVCAG